MPINVYWSFLEDEWMRAENPEPIYKKIIKSGSNKNSLSNLSHCPAISQYSKNMYGLKSVYDYNFYIENQEVKTNMYDQEFFNKHVTIRDIDKKFFSFQQRYIFFTDEDSLTMETYLHPFLEDNDIQKKCFAIPGSFDIGKWFRNVEFPFFLKNESSEFNINHNDIYTYIRFNTEKQIRFIKFMPTEKILFYVNSSINSSYGKNSYTKLSDIYKRNNYKNKILKEIKENLC